MVLGVYTRLRVRVCARALVRNTAPAYARILVPVRTDAFLDETELLS